MGGMLGGVCVLRGVICAFFFFALGILYGGSLFSQGVSPDSETSYLDKPYVPSTRPREALRDYRSGLYLRESRSGHASIYRRDFSLDTAMNFSFIERIGGVDYRVPTRLSFSQYDRYRERQSHREYFRHRSRELDEKAFEEQLLSLTPRIYVGPWLNRTFGGSFISFDPNILLTLNLGPRWNYLANPALPVNQRTNFLLDFKQQLTANVVGKVGDKLSIYFNYDTQAPFGGFSSDFKNNFKAEYTGYDEDIIKNIQFGNVSMPLENSLIRGSQNLFGLSLTTQFGRFKMTNVVSTQQGLGESLVIDGNVQGREFDILASDYSANKHFFLGHFFRDNYESWLSTRPQITSGIRVTNIEVYVLNRSNEAEGLRSVLGLMDMGESDRIHRGGNSRIISSGAGLPASNNSNSLYNELIGSAGVLRNLNESEALLTSWGLESGIDYERVNSARRLSDQEFSYHESLGILSLTRPLQNDEILAVAYEYTFNGQRHQVGELRADYQNLGSQEAIFLKLLRPSRIQISIPTWDLMLKNTYELNVASLERQDFELVIRYRDDGRGVDISTLNEGRRTGGEQLVELLGLDRLNINGDENSDGNFDFIEGVTVFSSTGVIRFPVLEPFGSHLRGFFDERSEADLIDLYVFDALYRLTQQDAERLTDLNKYRLVGRYRSSGSEGGEIRLPAFGIVDQSVSVSAGGTTLLEGVDYTVNYSLGVVNIVNPSILSSGKSLVINYEKADLLSSRNRTLLGTRVDYDISEGLVAGGTLIYLSDQPGSISRYQIGNAPVSNLKYGFDLSYEAELLGLTRALNTLPFISSSKPSQVFARGEMAQLLPGTSNRVEGAGTFYIDDFEAATLPISLGNFRSWHLASTPITPNREFFADGTLGQNDFRAHLSWYTVDTEFYRRGSDISLGESGIENHYARPIPPRELFAQRDVAQGVINQPTFDVAFFPHERGAYNYTSLLNDEGLLSSPMRNWGGITRAITHEVDFDKVNIEYLEFWLLDPFISGERGRVFDGRLNRNNTDGGRLVLNLGDISEDVIPDNRHGFEQGLPEDGSNSGVAITPWGRVPTIPYITPSFVNSQSARDVQDVGYDGLDDSAEQQFFSSFLSSLSPLARASVLDDPSADNYSFYLSGAFDAAGVGVVERYKYFTQTQGNTPLNTGNRNAGVGSNEPNNEDLNRDNTINAAETYYEYEIDLRPQRLRVGEGYIVDEVKQGDASWYLFRVPIKSPQRTQGNIDSFKSIKFMRMYLTQFSSPVVLRFVNFRLVESRWIRYEDDLSEAGAAMGMSTDFAVSSVSIEENSNALQGKSPYVLPPGIQRDENDFSLNQQRYNEQSLQLCVDNLVDGDARAVYKPLIQNLVNYKRLRMFFHAESEKVLQDGQAHAFLRLGGDYDQNYYEIAVPLQVTPAVVSGDIARAVWPLENEIDISLDDLSAVKVMRNRSSSSSSQPFMQKVGQYEIRVVGRPRLSQLRVLMIGIRNPLGGDIAPQQVCVWANELRMEGIDSRAGQAYNVKVTSQLADVAEVSFSSQYSTPGFGEIGDQIEARTQSTDFAYDFSTTMQLHKFIPARTGLNIPLFFSIEQSTSTPLFDPLDQDVPLNVVLDNIEEPDEYKRLVQSRTRRRSVNVRGLKKDYIQANVSPKPYHIENITLDMSYSDYIAESFTEEEIERDIFVGLAYDYRTEALFLEPFKDSEALSNPYFSLIRAQNLGLFPNTFSFSFSLDRRYRRKLLRDFLSEEATYEPVYEKKLTFQRDYGFSWPLFRSLQLHYAAKVQALIDEPEGEINTREERNMVWNNIWSLGRTQRYEQSLRSEYNVPINQFPLLDWTSTTLSYQASFLWQTASMEQIDILGNTIENARTIGSSISFDLQKLYNKVPFLSEGEKAGPSQTPAEADSVSGGFGGFLVGFFTMIKSLSFNYTLRNQTFLPGYRLTPVWLGFDQDISAPGYAFLLGSQSKDIRTQAASRGWLIQSDALSLPFRQQAIQEIGVQSMLLPFEDLSIQLNANRNVSANYEEIFRYEAGQYRSLTPSRKGSFSVSTIALASAFGKGRSEAFQRFSENRAVILSRLSPAHSLTHHDVLITAFKAAYLGRDPESISLSPFVHFPLPNWQMNYSGLTKIPALGDIFDAITLTHGYRSSYEIGDFTSSLLYNEGLFLSDGLLQYRNANILNDNGNLVPFYTLNGIQIAEEFNPLIGMELRFNDMGVRADYKRRRDASLSLANAQVSEGISHEVSMGYSFSRTGLRLPLRFFGQQAVLENTFSIGLAITYKNQQQEQYLLDGITQLTQGSRAWDFRFNMDYMLSQYVTAQFYVERSTNTPLLTNTFQRNITAVGFRVTVNWSN